MSLKDLLSKEWIRLIGVLILGITVGVIFYPTRQIEDRLNQQHQVEISQLKKVHAKELEYLDNRYTASVEDLKKKLIESDKKVSKLTNEVKTLQSKQKTSYYKVVRPDGTIEIKKFTESEVNESTKVISQIQEEFKVKIDEIESKWSNIHEERVSKIQKEFNTKESEYKNTIDKLSKSRSVLSNEKKFGLEVGIDNRQYYYGHATMDVWGPSFIGLHGDTNYSNTNIGIGVGLRF